MSLKTIYRSILPATARERLAPLKSYWYIFFHNLGRLLHRHDGVYLRRKSVNGIRMVFAGNDSIFVASPKRWNRYLAGIDAKLRSLAEQYGYGQYYTVGSDEVVLDIGANVGEFSMFCAKGGAKTYSIEADRRAFAPLVLNANRHPNIKTFNLAIWNENRNLTFYSNVDEADSSGIQPEHFDTVVEQRAVTLDSFTELMGIGEIKLIKCDAEGAEPEVLAGATETLGRTRFVAFDCGPERAGQPTFDECANLLKDLGFDVLTTPDPTKMRQMLVASNQRFAENMH